MKRIDHPLLCSSLGSQKTLTSLHFGAMGGRPKVYIQASLHAEELPGMLVAHHLRGWLERAHDQGLLKGEVVLVPVANPIGLSQRLDHKPMGRFELDTSENFNRHYPDFAELLWPRLRSQLDADAMANVRRVRQAMADYLGQYTPTTELQSLRHTLLTLAHDADYMLDLHCDCEGVLHFYTEDPCWPQLSALAHYLGAQAVLLARNSGDSPIDEALSGVWWQLAQRAQQSGLTVSLPQGCCSTTIELRGERDVRHDLAAQDAQAIVHWLMHIGLWQCDAPPPVPSARCAPTPLAGSQTLRARRPGVLVIQAPLGQMLAEGDPVAEVIDPISGRADTVCTDVAGVFYAHIRDRYVQAGGEIGKVAGAKAFRTGPLLGA
ncbi:MAG: M14 family metallopeptidase [Rhodoferax sp.]